MTKEMIEKRLEQLNKEEFFIVMADFLSRRDWEVLDEIHREQKELEKMLKEM